MPSIHHEALVQLFRNQPLLAVQLLERVLGLSVPRYGEAVLDDVTFTQLAPTEYRADAVVVLSHRGRAVHAIVVEVQLRAREDKLYTWPLYAMAVRASRRCPVSVLVVTPDQKVAAWASQPIDLGPGSSFTALVVGPEAVPRVTNIAEAAARPELAILSVLAPGGGAHPEELALPALHAAAALDPSDAGLYADLVLAALGPAARAALEEMMKTGYQLQSDFAKEYFAKGHEEGELNAYRRVLATLLEQRFGVLPEPLRNRIKTCTDSAQLLAWLTRVPTITSTDEIDS